MRLFLVFSAVCAVLLVGTAAVWYLALDVALADRQLRRAE